MGCGGLAPVRQFKHPDGLHGCLLGQFQRFADSGHGIDGIFQLDREQLIQFGNRITELSEQHIQAGNEVRHFFLVPVVYGNDATDVDRV